MKYEDPTTGVVLTIPDEEEPWTQVQTVIALTKAALWGFLQVLAVSMVTVAIVHKAYLANFAASLAVNMFWLYNVNTAIKGSKSQKVAYALGAATGSVTGAFLGHTLLN